MSSEETGKTFKTWVVPPEETIAASCTWRGHRVVLRVWREHQHVMDHPDEVRPAGWMVSVIAEDGIASFSPDVMGFAAHAYAGKGGATITGMEFMADAMAALEKHAEVGDE